MRWNNMKSGGCISPTLFIKRNILIWGFLMSIGSITIAQTTLTLGGVYTDREQYNIIKTDEPTIIPFRVVESTIRLDMILWKDENWGANLGYHVQRYRVGFHDLDPDYFMVGAHGALSAWLIPVGVVYRKKLFKVFKRPFYVYGQGGLIAGLNFFSINNRLPGAGSRTQDFDGRERTYNYRFTFDYAPVFINLDLGIRLDYQLLETFSVGFQARYYQGFQKIGTLDANYFYEGGETRSVQVTNIGSSLYLGGGIQFHIPLKRKKNIPNEDDL